MAITPLSTLVYDRKGAGETVVLIHGIGHRRQGWNPIFEKLAESYDVIAVDLAGFGESAPYPKDVPYTMDNACADLAANFALWGVTKPHVVGNSLGGAISLELAARGLVSSVTALSPAGFFGPIDRLPALGILSVLRGAALVPDSALKALSGLPLGRRVIGAVLYAHPERMTAEDTFGDALALKRTRAFGRTIKSGLHYKFDSPVKAPVTIAWGTKDRILPFKQSNTARKRLPDAIHLPLMGAGHVPMIDSPDEIIRLIHATVTAARIRQVA